MNLFDIIFSAIILVFFLLGMKRGMTRELLSLVALTAGYLAAERYYLGPLSFILNYINDQVIAKVISYTAIFLIGGLAGAVLSNLARVLFAFNNPGYLSRTVGGGFGIIKGFLVCLLFFFIVQNFLLPFSDDLQSSIFTQMLNELKRIIGGINFA